MEFLDVEAACSESDGSSSCSGESTSSFIDDQEFSDDDVPVNPYLNPRKRKFFGDRLAFLEPHEVEPEKKPRVEAKTPLRRIVRLVKRSVSPDPRICRKFPSVVPPPAVHVEFSSDSDLEEEESMGCKLVKDVPVKVVAEDVVVEDVVAEDVVAEDVVAATDDLPVDEVHPIPEIVKKKDVLYNKYIFWNGKRRRYFVRHCKVCGFDVPAYFWLIHLRLKKHKDKMSKCVFIPMLHDSKTFLNDVKEYEEVRMCEDDREDEEVIVISDDEDVPVRVDFSVDSCKASCSNDVPLEERTRKCKFCPERFHSFDDLMRHELAYHDEEEEIEMNAKMAEIDEAKKKSDPLFCDVCKVKVYSEEYMSAHLKGKKHKLNASNLPSTSASIPLEPAPALKSTERMCVEESFVNNSSKFQHNPS